MFITNRAVVSSRGLGAKDWSVMIEGCGGMLDRMDSVSFAAPVLFHIVRFFFT
jgi:phosphatidate cytidylyltransferase